MLCPLLFWMLLAPGSTTHNEKKEEKEQTKKKLWWKDIDEMEELPMEKQNGEKRRETL